jgi:hypothetical protein
VFFICYQTQQKEWKGVVRGRLLVNLNDVVFTDFGVFFFKKAQQQKEFLKIAHLKSYL